MYISNVAIQVQVSDGVLTFEPAVAVNNTMLHPPSPVKQIISNTSLTCQVYFDEDQIQIEWIMVSVDGIIWDQTSALN